MSEWIIQFIERFGYGGIAVLMVLENVFPPIPSELIMPFAGYSAARGALHPAGVMAAGLLGSMLGTLPWYWAGRRLGSERIRQWAARHGRWLTLHPQDIEKAEARFRRHGAGAVMVGRLVPAVRSAISLPAGIERMPVALFLLWSGAGSLLWIGALTGLGFLLEGSWEKAKDAVEWATRGIVAALVIGYVWRFVRFDSRPCEPAA